jgi:hypothetical protein
MSLIRIGTVARNTLTYGIGQRNIGRGLDCFGAGRRPVAYCLRGRFSQLSCVRSRMMTNATTIAAPATADHHSHCVDDFAGCSGLPFSSDTERGSSAIAANVSSAFILAESSIGLATGSPRVLLDPGLPGMLLPPGWPAVGTPRCRSLGGLLIGEALAFAPGEDDGAPGFGNRADEPRGCPLMVIRVLSDTVSSGAPGWR